MSVPIIGNVPRGDDYFGQEILIQNIWDKLEKNNILLAAPRRFGKTGAMYKLLDESKPGILPVYTNLEPIGTAGDFMVELISKIFQKRPFQRFVNILWEGSKEIGAFFRNLPEDIDLGGIKIAIRDKTDVSENWYAYGDRIMDLISSEDPTLLLLLDEFAVMIDHILRKEPSDAERLLRWFRAARTAPDTKTRFIIGSSIHLIPLLDDKGLADTVNDLYVQELKPFSDDTARAYIKAVFTTCSMEISDNVIDAIIQLVGIPIPYLLAVLLSAIIDRHKATHIPATVELVTSVFEDELLGGSTSATFLHYRSRIDSYYPGWEGRAARTILKALSRAENGLENNTIYSLFLQTSGKMHSTQSEEEFMRLMYKLDNDFYISTSDGRYDFYSRVLKLWWRSSYGFQGE